MITETIFSVMVTGTAVFNSQGMACSCVDDKPVIKGLRISMPSCVIEPWSFNEDYSVVYLVAPDSSPKKGTAVVRCQVNQ